MNCKHTRRAFELFTYIISFSELIDYEDIESVDEILRFQQLKPSARSD